MRYKQYMSSGTAHFFVTGHWFALSRTGFLVPFYENDILPFRPRWKHIQALKKIRYRAPDISMFLFFKENFLDKANAIV